MKAPKKAATPVRTPRISPSPIAISPSVISEREPALVMAVEEEVEEIAVPLERDRRAPGAAGIAAALASTEQRRAAVWSSPGP